MNLNIQEILKTHRGYFMFSREGCCYCDWTKEYFEEHNIPLDIITINDYEERLEMYKILNKHLGRSDIKTVPQIFCDSKYIGGSDNLNSYFLNIQPKKIHTNPFDDPEIMGILGKSNINKHTYKLDESTKLITNSKKKNCPCCVLS